MAAFSVYFRKIVAVTFAIDKRSTRVKAQTFGAELGTVVNSRTSVTWQTCSSRRRTRNTTALFSKLSSLPQRKIHSWSGKKVNKRMNWKFTSYSCLLNQKFPRWSKFQYARAPLKISQISQTAYNMTRSYYEASLLGITNFYRRVTEKHLKLPRSITEFQKCLKSYPSIN